MASARQSFETCAGGSSDVQTAVTHHCTFSSRSSAAGGKNSASISRAATACKSGVRSANARMLLAGRPVKPLAQKPIITKNDTTVKSSTVKKTLVTSLSPSHATSNIITSYSMKAAVQSRKAGQKGKFGKLAQEVVTESEQKSCDGIAKDESKDLSGAHVVAALRHEDTTHQQEIRAAPSHPTAAVATAAAAGRCQNGQSLLQCLMSWRSAKAHRMGVNPSAVAATYFLQQAAAAQPVTFVELEPLLEIAGCKMRMTSIAGELLAVVRNWLSLNTTPAHPAERQVPGVPAVFVKSNSKSCNKKTVNGFLGQQGSAEITNACSGAREVVEAPEFAATSEGPTSPAAVVNLEQQHTMQSHVQTESAFAGTIVANTRTAETNYTSPGHAHSQGRFNLDAFFEPAQVNATCGGPAAAVQGDCRSEDKTSILQELGMEGLELQHLNKRRKGNKANNSLYSRPAKHYSTAFIMSAEDEMMSSMSWAACAASHSPTLSCAGAGATRISPFTQIQRPFSVQHADSPLDEAALPTTTHARVGTLEYGTTSERTISVDLQHMIDENHWQLDHGEVQSKVSVLPTSAGTSGTHAATVQHSSSAVSDCERLQCTAHHAAGHVPLLEDAGQSENVSQVAASEIAQQHGAEGGHTVSGSVATAPEVRPTASVIASQEDAMTSHDDDDDDDGTAKACALPSEPSKDVGAASDSDVSDHSHHDVVADACVGGGLAARPCEAAPVFSRYATELEACKDFDVEKFFLSDMVTDAPGHKDVTTDEATACTSHEVDKPVRANRPCISTVGSTGTVKQAGNAAGGGHKRQAPSRAASVSVAKSAVPGQAPDTHHPWGLSVYDLRQLRRLFNISADTVLSDSCSQAADMSGQQCVEPQKVGGNAPSHVNGYAVPMVGIPAGRVPRAPPVEAQHAPHDDANGNAEAGRPKSKVLYDRPLLRERSKFNVQEDVWIVQQALAGSDVAVAAMNLRRSVSSVLRRLHKMLRPYPHERSQASIDHRSNRMQGSGLGLNLRSLLLDVLQETAVESGSESRDASSSHAGDMLNGVAHSGGVDRRHSMDRQDSSGYASPEERYHTSDRHSDLHADPVADTEEVLVRRDIPFRAPLGLCDPKKPLSQIPNITIRIVHVSHRLRGSTKRKLPDNTWAAAHAAELSTRAAYAVDPANVPKVPRAGAAFAKAHAPGNLDECSVTQLRSFLQEAGFNAKHLDDLTSAATTAQDESVVRAQLYSLAVSALPQWEVRRVLACEELPDGTDRHAAVLQSSLSSTHLYALQIGQDAPAVAAALTAVRGSFKRLSLLLHPDKHTQQRQAGHGVTVSAQDAARAFQMLSSAQDCVLQMLPTP